MQSSADPSDILSWIPPAIAAVVAVIGLFMLGTAIILGVCIRISPTDAVREENLARCRQLAALGALFMVPGIYFLIAIRL